MDNIQITPIGNKIKAKVKIPGSKSLTNRAMLIAALAEGTTRLENALFSDDSNYFAGALQSLGFEIVLSKEKSEIVINGLSGRIPAQKANLFIGNAGTAARFLAAFLTLGNGEYIIDGDPRMRERPIGDLVSSLSKLGASITPVLHKINQDESSTCPPIKILGSGLPGGTTQVNGDISSQFLSALLMVSPYALNTVIISVVTDLNSKPYVDMTIKVMSDFGVTIVRNGYKKFDIDRGHYTSINSYFIEPDASAASYFFAAAALLGGSVRIDNLSHKSKQGDIAFVDVLRKMGCIVVENDKYIELFSPPSNQGLAGIDVDMSDIPDTAQTLAAIAPFSSGPTHIRGIASARVKESDRVSATCTELARLGVRVEERNDGFSIYPCKNFTPCSIKTYNDHRMAMSFALIGLRVPGVTIENPGCVSKTFPNFFEVLESLR